VKAEVVVDGIPFGEGPVWCPDDTLVVTSVSHGVLYRVWPDAARAERIAATEGGANGAALASDGGFLVTQNGGTDFSALPGLFPDPPPFRAATPGLQRVRPDGAVEYVLDTGLLAPNDLAVGRDGTVWFTDPGPPPGMGAATDQPRVGRVMALRPDGRLDVVADGFWYCNGIAVEPTGALVVVERTGLLRLLPDGAREWVIEMLGPGAGDGFCLDSDGRYYVASTLEHGVRVVEPDGTVVDFLEIPGDGLTTNCCFGGDGLRTLFATDALPGRVVAWEGMPTPGLPLPAWPAP
jgi:gluconolactonase